MKYLFSLILIAFLFSSCDITKRRYMSGYSIEWKQKAPKPNTTKESVASVGKIPATAPTLSAITAGQTIYTKETNKKVALAIADNLPAISNSAIKGLHTNSATYSPKQFNSRGAYEIDTTLQKMSKQHPHFYTGDEEEDEYAHKSLVDGILALASPAAAFLIMLGIALSVGETIATAPAYAVVIFALGCVVGLMFAVFAFINGFQGLNEINAQPDTYTGAGDAVLGMILAALEPLGIIAYFLIRSL
jgi:hypothetical protein